jgi:pimeloyl-ACP methyl ester carboxylesterase
MSTIYVLSGLGADKRAFQGITFGNFPVVHLPWVKPSSSDTLVSYAHKLAQLITEKDPIIIGYSFGGMLATEIAKILPVKKVILLASCKHYLELPITLRIADKLKIDKLIPAFLYKHTKALMYYYFSIRKQAHKKLVKAIIDDTDPTFIKWAIHAILNWHNKQIPNGLIHIHGMKDRLLPIKYCNNIDQIIKNAGHYMTITHTNAVNKQLNRILLANDQ